MVWILSFQRAALFLVLCGAIAMPCLAQAPSSIGLSTTPDEAEKTYFGDQRGRFYLDLTGWTVVPASSSPDGLVHYRYQNNNELSFTVLTDAKAVGDPFADPIDRAETLRDLIGSLHWTETRILRQKIIKVGDLNALDVIIVGNHKLRYKGRFVFLQQDQTLHQLQFTMLSSEFDWLHQPINRVLDSFHVGKPPSHLMIFDKPESKAAKAISKF